MNVPIQASEITADTHVWVGENLIYVTSVRSTATGHVSLNGGTVLLAGDKRVFEKR